MSERTIGQIIDSLGVTVDDIGPDDLPSDVMVLMEVIGEDGMVGLVIASTESQSWVKQLGLVQAAHQIITSSGYQQGDDL